MYIPINQKIIEETLGFLKNYYPLSEEPKIVAFIVPEQEWINFMTLYFKFKRWMEQAIQQIQHSSSTDSIHLKIQTVKHATHYLSKKEKINDLGALYFQAILFTIWKSTNIDDQIKPLIEMLKETKYGVAIRASLHPYVFALIEELLHIIEIESNKRIFTDNLKVDAEIVNVYFREYIKNRGEQEK
jgi:hypothetical protein